MDLPLNDKILAVEFWTCGSIALLLEMHNVEYNSRKDDIYSYEKDDISASN
jgi:hypothetical protein